MTARRHRAVLALAGLLAGAVATPVRAQSPDAQDPTAVELVLHGVTPDGSVAFGAPFAVDVVRRWRDGRQPEGWTGAALAPLRVDELDVRTAHDGGFTVETRQYRAYAFQRGAVTLLPGAAAQRLLLVDSCLPADDSGNLELPPAPPLAIDAARRRLGRQLLLGLAAGGLTWLLLLGWRAARRRAAAPSAQARLRAAVDALVLAPATTAAQRRAEAVAATSVLREADRLAAFAAPPAVQQLLDDAKFAGRAWSATEREQVHAALQQAVAAVPEDAR